MAEPADRRLTIVSFHAHPDDEALLTGGSLAEATRAGHRVVIVVATRGEEGLAGAEDGSGERLAQTRWAELVASAGHLGCADVRWLGYRDSGLRGASRADAFAGVAVDEAAARLAEVLLAERADVLTSYDAHGGYGHPDHVQVHRVSRRAVELSGTPRLLEATAPGDVLERLLAALRILGSPFGRAPVRTTRLFSRRRDITHVVRLSGAGLAAKRRALAAHHTQTRSPDGFRVLDRLLALPAPLARAVLGREWFVEVVADPHPTPWPASRRTTASPSGVPGQWRAIASGPARLTTERSTSATSRASSA